MEARGRGEGPAEGQRQRSAGGDPGPDPSGPRCGVCVRCVVLEHRHGPPVVEGGRWRREAEGNRPPPEQASREPKDRSKHVPKPGFISQRLNVTS